MQDAEEKSPEEETHVIIVYTYILQNACSNNAVIINNIWQVIISFYDTKYAKEANRVLVIFYKSLNFYCLNTKMKLWGMSCAFKA